MYYLMGPRTTQKLGDPMKSKMRSTSFLFSAETLDELRRLAHQDSLESDKEVTASSIVRDAVEAYLRGRRKGPALPGRIT